MLYNKLRRARRARDAHHVALEVSDTAAALDGNSAHESYPRSVGIRTGVNRKRQMNLSDPDRARIELMDRTVVGKPVPSATAPAPR